MIFMNWKVPLFEIYWDQEDIQSVQEVISRGASWTNGPEVNKFEDAIAKYLNIKYVLTFSSGTTALHALMLALGINQKDEVIVPSFTFISTANSVLFCNGTPVFSEIEDLSYGLDSKKIKNKINKRTKCIIPVHYGGTPCFIEELNEIATDNDIFLVEDCAESFGASVRKKKVGTFGDASILSFCQNKIFTTGEGGAVTTNSEELYEKLKLLRSHGRLEKDNYFNSTELMDYISIGYNFRMSSISAALGISQIKKIDELINKRREVANYISSRLEGIDNLILPNELKDNFNVYQMYTLRVKKDLRNRLMEFLRKKEIMTKIYFSPIHLTSFYRSLYGYKRNYLPITEKISDEVVSIPIYPHLKKDKIDYVIDNIEEFFRGYL